MPVTGIDRAKRSSRSAGAVGGVDRPPVVYQLAPSLIMPHHSVLDFGSGSQAVHAQALRSKGINVTAHDYHAKPGIHDPNALKRRYDVVLASNVLNVQDSPRLLATTLNDIANSVNPAGGFALVNFPKQPRYDAYKGMYPQDAVSKLEVALKRRFKHVERHPSGTNAEPIWILKDPRYSVAKKP